MIIAQPGPKRKNRSRFLMNPSRGAPHPPPASSEEDRRRWTSSEQTVYLQRTHRQGERKCPERSSEQVTAL
jgi:hypothetical protein